MQAAADYVASLHVARDEEERRSEVRRRRRVDFIASGNLEREQRSRASLRASVRQCASADPAEERSLRVSLGAMGVWWDLVSAHILAERRECAAAARLQAELAAMSSVAMARRDGGEEAAVVDSDARRLRVLRDKHAGADRRIAEAAVGEAIDDILCRAYRAIDFVNAHALPPTRKNLLARAAIRPFTRSNNARSRERRVGKSMDDEMLGETCKEGETRGNAQAVADAEVNVGVELDAETDALFREVFDGSPFARTSEAFAQLLYDAYSRAAPPGPPPNALDRWRAPLFAIAGPKYAGKTTVARQAAAELGLECFSDRDLVECALAALKQHTALPPALAVEEDSSWPPVLSAVEVDGAPEAYSCTATPQQRYVTPRPPSEWVLLGEEVEAVLRRGDGVSPALLARLVRLAADDASEKAKSKTQAESDEETADAGQAGAEVSGVLFDGAVESVELLQALSTSIERRPHPFALSLHCWTSAVTQPTLDDGALSVARPPPRPVEKSERPQRQESRARGGRRGVDLASLPPPVLPPVDEMTLSLREMDIILADESAEPLPAVAAAVRLRCGARAAFERFAALRTGRPMAAAALLHRAARRDEAEWPSVAKWLSAHAVPLTIVDGEQAEEVVAHDVADALRIARTAFAAARQVRDEADAARRHRERLMRQRSQQEAQREEVRRRLAEVYADAGAALPRELELPPPPPYFEPPEDMPSVVLGAIAALGARYNEAYRWSAITVEKLAATLFAHRSSALSVFARFWDQPDEKQERLDRFNAAYKELPAVLRSQVVCKEELHLLVDQLREELFRSVEATGREAAAKTEQITRRDAFLSSWCVSVCNVGAAMVQTEIERFLAAVNVAILYFSAVVGEPASVEEMEAEAVFLRAANDAPAEATRGKEKKVQGTKKAPRLEDIVERTVEDTFTDCVAKLMVGMTTLAERFATALTTATKVRDHSKASPSATPSSAAAAASASSEEEYRVVLIISKCQPIVEAEVAAANERVGCIRQFIAQLLREGEAYCANLREEMITHTRERQRAQASAVNTAIYVIRCAIEEEQPLSAMHLGRDTFYVHPLTPTITTTTVKRTSDGRPPTSRPSDASLPLSMPPPIPIYVSEPSMVHATLTTARLIEMVETLRIVAPDYALSRAEFFYIVKLIDYAGAATRFGRLRTMDELFSIFDPHDCGFIDWREFVVHLLLWCAPPPDSGESSVPVFAITDCSVTHLMETRSDLGLQPIGEDEFLDIPFFFDNCITDARLAAYGRVLWLTFSRADSNGNNLLDPYPLLAFLCMDVQPVRGAQKAFYVLARDVEGVFLPSEMDEAFHVKVTNPRNMCLPDVFSRENIAALFSGASSLSFQGVCERAMGRCMLNNNEAFHRKSFVVETEM